MYLTIYRPSFFPTNTYEAQIDSKLHARDTLTWDPKKYQHLLNIKKAAAAAAASFEQLQKIIRQQHSEEKSAGLVSLEGALAQILKSFLQDESIVSQKNSIMNFISYIQQDLNEMGSINSIIVDKILSACNLFMNTIAFLICAATLGVSYLFFTGPVGMISLGVGLVILATAMLCLTAYTAYVEGRFIADKQWEEVDTFINLLFDGIPEDFISQPGKDMQSHITVNPFS